MNAGSNLFRRCFTPSNLRAGWEKVRDNRGGPGVDGVSIAQFERDLDGRLAKLGRELITGAYSPAPLLRVCLQEEGKKARYLGIPAVRDRVAQSAAAVQLTPLFEAQFEDCSYAYRRGRSVQQAVERVMRHRSEGFQYVVDADIHSFFDEIDHTILIHNLRELLGDERLIALCERWIKAEVQEGQKLWRMAKGVPQGAPLSPLMANLYLDQLDEVMLEENLRIVRFADDFLILCRSADRAEHALRLTEEVLEKLHLRLNPVKTRLTDFEQGFRFLGHVFVRSLIMRATEEEGQANVDAPPLLLVGQDSTRSEVPAESAPTVGTALGAALQEVGFGRSAFMGSGEGSVSIADSDAYQDEVDLDDLPMPLPNEAALSFDPLLRTLYIIEQGCELRKQADRFVVVKSERVQLEVPVTSVDIIMIFGNSQLTTPALQLALMRGIPVAFITRLGNYYGRVEAANTEPVSLHEAQFKFMRDSQSTLTFSREIVRAKIANTRLVLRRFFRHRATELSHRDDLSLKESEYRAERATATDALLGFEGSAAALYFKAIGTLVDSAWSFNGRQRQPPPDPINAMLSFGYTLLHQNVAALVQARGLNAHAGIYHSAGGRHMALVSDLVEEFRAIIVDAMVLSLILRRRVTPQDFTKHGEGCRMSTDMCRRFVRAFETKIEENISHPDSTQPLDYRRVIDAQVRRFVRAVRNPAQPYRAFTPR